MSNYAKDYYQIDFRSALNLFYKQKIIILFSSCVGLIVGLLLLFTIKPLYETDAYISPPILNDLYPINQYRINFSDKLLPQFTIDITYKLFFQELLNKLTKQLFYDDIFLNSNKHPPLTFKEFNKYLTIALSRKLTIAEGGTLPEIKMTYKSQSVQENRYWIQKYLYYVEQKVINTLLREDNEQRKSIIAKISHEINSIRNIAEIERLTRIQQLQKAITTATLLGLKDAAFRKSEININFLINPNWSYLLGQDLLNAELKNIISKTPDDSFVPEKYSLEQKKLKLAFLNSISIDTKKIKLFNIVEYNPETQLKNKFVLIIWCIFTGILTGIIYVSIKQFLHNQKSNVHSLKVAD